MEIRSLEKTNLQQLLDAWSLAFQDYPYQWTADELMRMLIRRGYVASLSYGAFDGDRLVAFTLNGFGDYNSVRIAYDTGTGTIPEYRGRGLATKIFMAATMPLKEAGAKQYVLEVLVENTNAITVYKKLGFSVSRNFNYFINQIPDVRFSDQQEVADLSMKVIEWNDHGIDTYLTQMQSFCDYAPSWQNTFDAVMRSPAGFILLGAFQGAALVGYVIIGCKAGDITQLAVQSAHRRKGIGSWLFRKACEYISAERIQLINVDARCTALTDFLAVHNMPVTGAQYEMILKLD